ncbi:aldo/keto reductase [bacterium]|nr:aldo/keto reductase [bacterium]
MEMQYKNLGSTGLKVSRICLGAMNFGVYQEESKDIEIVNEALDMGINFFDTANGYARGKSEEILGKALKGKREDIVLATKCWAGNPTGGGLNNKGSSRVNILKSVEGCLKRLQTDYIDLFIMHRPDEVLPDLGKNPTPTEETISALTDLVKEGKVRYIGSSCYQSWKLVETQMLARYEGFEKICCDQLKYNILDRFVERQVLPVCKKYGIGVNIFSPLEFGWLSGKYHRNQPPPADSRGAKKGLVNLESDSADRFFDILEKLEPIVADLGITMAQFALAWLLHRPVVTSVIAGPRLVEHLRDNVKAVEVKLSQEIMDEVDKIAPPRSGNNPNYENHSL